MDLNDDLQKIGTEIEEIRTTIREETPGLFDFDVTIGNITYNANKNSFAFTIEPSSQAREQLSNQFGGVNVSTNGQLEFEYAVVTQGENP